MLFGMKHDHNEMAARLATDFFSPAGPIPVERLVTRHIDAFEDMRTSGLTWEQISRLLANAGVLRRDGGAFPPSHLRGVYGRQRKRLQEKRAAKPSSRTPPFPNTGFLSPSAAPADNRPLVASTPAVADPRATAAVTSTPALEDDGEVRTGSGCSETAIGAMTGGTNESPPSRDRNRVLAMMRQAALARRST